MLNEKLEQLADVILENGNNENVDKEIIVYGLSSAIEQGASIATTILLGYLFRLMLESVVFLVFFSFLRTYAGGYHCQKAFNCYLMSSGVVGLVLAIVKFTPYSYILIISGIMLVASIPILLKFAPTETPNKLFDEVEQWHYRKKTIIHLMIECVFIDVLFLLNLYSFAFAVCLGIMVSASSVFLQKNYKTFYFRKEQNL